MRTAAQANAAQVFARRLDASTTLSDHSVVHFPLNDDKWVLEEVEGPSVVCNQSGGIWHVPTQSLH